jgi:ACDE family multidrug resistance protein
VHALIPFLFMANFAVYAFSNTFFFLAPYLQSQGMSSSDAGLIVSVFYAATTFARPVGGWIVERCGVRRSMIASSFGCAVASAAFAFLGSDPVPLVTVRVLTGGCFSVFVVAMTTYQAISVPEEIRGASFALVTIGSVFPLFTVVPFSDFLLRTGSSVLFLSMPPIAAAACLLLSVRLRPIALPTTGNDRRSWGTYGDLFQTTPAVRMATSCLLFGLCDASIVYLSSFALGKGLVPSAFMIPNAIGATLIRFFGRDLFNRLPRTRLAGPSFALMAVCLVATSYASSNLLFAFCGLVYGMGMGYAFPAHLSFTGDLVPANLRAKASSLVFFSMDFSWFLLPLYMGYAAEAFGIVPSFRAFAFFCVAASLFITWIWIPPNKTRQTRPRPSGD